MKIHNINLDSLININNINLAIGNFDGIHLGHQKLIQKLVIDSKEKNFVPAVMCFSPHPRQFFSQEYDNFNIISDNLKIDLIKKLGVQHLIILNFDNFIASLSPEEFIEIILVKKLNIKQLVVGYDFKFGKNRRGDVALLKEKSLTYNFQINILEPIKSNQNSEIFSSSSIRENIKKGNLEKVNLYLGRNWSLTGTVIQGDKRGSEIDFPTANIIPPSLIKPKYGVYAVKVLYEGLYINGIANFGKRPTVDGKKLLLETHLFDFNANLYGKDLTVEFLTFIRDEKKFNNIDELVIQIQKDVNIARGYHLKK